MIFALDLNYIMGSQRPWTVFELLDLLFAVIIKELEIFRVCDSIAIAHDINNFIVCIIEGITHSA